MRATAFIRVEVVDGDAVWYFRLQKGMGLVEAAKRAVARAAKVAVSTVYVGTDPKSFGYPTESLEDWMGHRFNYRAAKFCADHAEYAAQIEFFYSDCMPVNQFN